MSKKIIKAIIIVVAFVLCYLGIMVVAMDYLYPYPAGVLDTDERAVEARYYKIVYQDKIDGNTTIYFTRSNNGVGSDVHFGTYDSSMPDILANFFCKAGCSEYVSIDTVNYTVASDKTVYLFGVTTDENTTEVDVTFYKSDDETQLYEMQVNDQCYYYENFDQSWADYSYSVTGYNAEGYCTFEYYYETPLSAATTEAE